MSYLHHYLDTLLLKVRINGSLNVSEREPVRDQVGCGVLGGSAELVFPVERIAGGSPDPFDDMVLECTMASKADFLVGGDKKHLLKPGSFKGIPIIDPSEFLDKLKEA